jgi:hypothetical protein
MTKTFIYSPEMAEIAKDLRKRLAAGEIRYDDAMKAMKAAVREAIRTKAVVIKDDSEDN